MNRITCRTCQITKEAGHYYFIDKEHTRIDPRCKECHRTRMKLFNRENVLSFSIGKDDLNKKLVRNTKWGAVEVLVTKL